MYPLPLGAMSTATTLRRPFLEHSKPTLYIFIDNHQQQREPHATDKGEEAGRMIRTGVCACVYLEGCRDRCLGTSTLTQSVALFTPTHAAYVDTGAGAGALRIFCIQDLDFQSIAITKSLTCLPQCE